MRNIAAWYAQLLHHDVVCHCLACAGVAISSAGESYRLGFVQLQVFLKFLAEP